MTDHVENLPSRNDDTSRHLSALMTIGDVAKRYGLTLRALRFYEDRGLVRPLRHGLSRFYDRATCDRLEAILYGKKLGLTLNEIADRIAQLGDDVSKPLILARPHEVSRELARLEEKRSTIDDAITALRGMLDGMKTLTSPEHRLTA